VVQDFLPPRRKVTKYFILDPHGQLLTRRDEEVNEHRCTPINTDGLWVCCYVSEKYLIANKGVLERL